MANNFDLTYVCSLFFSKFQFRKSSYGIALSKLFRLATRISYSQSTSIPIQSSGKIYFADGHKEKEKTAKP